MKNELIIKILALHGMDFEEIDGRIIWHMHGTQGGAAFVESVDITGISKMELYSELGY